MQCSKRYQKTITNEEADTDKPIITAGSNKWCWHWNWLGTDPKDAEISGLSVTLVNQVYTAKKWFCKPAANSLLLYSAVPSLYSQGCLHHTSLVLLDWQGRDESMGESSWVLQRCIHRFPDTILCCCLSGTLLMFNERKRTTQLEGSKSASWAPWSHRITFPCLTLTLKNSMKVAHPTFPRLPELFSGSHGNLGLKLVSELVQETYSISLLQVWQTKYLWTKVLLQYKALSIIKVLTTLTYHLAFPCSRQYLETTRQSFCPTLKGP